VMMRCDAQEIKEELQTTKNFFCALHRKLLSEQYAFVRELD